MNLKKQILLLIFSFTYISSISSSCLAGNLFTAEEETKLKALVNNSGSNPNWVQIANELNQIFHPNKSDNKRTARQCRERYNNYLSGTNKSPMSESDLTRLKELVAISGYKWNSILKYFPGRTEVELKNAFFSHNHNSNINSAEDPFEIEDQTYSKDEFPNEEPVTVNGFKYKLMSNISKRGECFWNILRKHMGNTLKTNTILQQVASEIGVEFNESLDYFKLDDFFRALSRKEYSFGYTLALIDPNHPETSVEQQGFSVEGGQILKLALFGDFNNGNDTNIGHYVEAQNNDEPEEPKSCTEHQQNVDDNEKSKPSNSLSENSNNYELYLFEDMDDNTIPF